MLEGNNTQKRLNILFVLIGLGLGGSERVVLDLVRNLPKSRFNVYLAYFREGELKASFSNACKRIFHLRKGSGLDVPTMLRLYNIIHDYNISIINSHHYAPFVFSYVGSKILHNRSLIFTQHSVGEVEQMPTIHKCFCNLAFFRTDSVIGVSKEIALSLKNTYPIHSNKILCITNAVDIDRFAINVDRTKIRAKLGIHPSDVVIGTVANFRKVKNHACLLKAFRRIAHTYPETRLLFVGQGCFEAPEDSEDDIKSLVNLFGLTERVIFAGYRNDVPNLLKTMDIFCLPSFAEGLPVSVLEAMASGVSVVGSDVSGIKEIISTGKTGLLFPSNDHRLLAKALERLINDADLRSALATQAFDFVTKSHGIDQWVERYEQLFGSNQVGQSA